MRLRLLDGEPPEEIPLTMTGCPCPGASDALTLAWEAVRDGDAEEAERCARSAETCWEAVAGQFGRAEREYWAGQFAAVRERLAPWLRGAA